MDTLIYISAIKNRIPTKYRDINGIELCLGDIVTDGVNEYVLLYYYGKIRLYKGLRYIHATDHSEYITDIKPELTLVESPFRSRTILVTDECDSVLTKYYKFLRYLCIFTTFPEY